MASQTLEDVYQEEIADLISANIQMQTVVDRMASKVHDQSIKQLLTSSVTAIGKHTTTLRGMHQGDHQTECRAMAGLTEEARQHAVDANLPAKLRDAAMLAHQSTNVSPRGSWFWHGSRLRAGAGPHRRRDE